MRRGQRRSHAAGRQPARGAAEVELVVAILLGLLLLVGAVTVFMQGTTTARTSAPESRLEETLRAAFDVLEPDVRMANYWGLTNRAEFMTGSATPAARRTPIDALVSNNCGNNWTANLATFVDAHDGGGYDLACPADHAAPWADVLVVRRASAGETVPRAGRIQIQTNRQAGQLFADGIVPAGFAPAPRSATHDLVVHAYYVGELAAGPDGRREWALRRQALAPLAGGGPGIVDAIVARGIVDLQVQFGVDTDGDGNADVYVNPGAAELATGRIVSVKLRLTALADGGERDGAAGLPGAVARGPPGEQRRRLVMQKTIALRNVPGP